MQIKGYHGTCDTIERFSHEFMGETTANNVGGFYFSDNEKVAMDYSIEAYKRKYEYDYETGKCMDECELQEKAENQAHVYECQITFNNPLIIDASEIRANNEWLIQRCGINIISAEKMNFLVNTLQGGAFEKWAQVKIEFQDDLLRYFEDEIYNEKTKEYEYIEKVPYDGLIVKNSVDSASDNTNYIESTIIVALHDWQIQILNKIELQNV